ncbi:hypothetical protein IG631_21027 [Alternaria alternata]|nr:hypothetical protein IG631_21027 [Alternaria alternata]
MARYTIEEGKSTRIASLPPSTVLTAGTNHNPRSCKWACTCVVLHASTALAFLYVGKATNPASAETFELNCSQESRKTQRLDSGTEQYHLSAGAMGRSRQMKIIRPVPRLERMVVNLIAGLTGSRWCCGRISG